MQTFNTILNVNTLVVVESLGPDELHTGRKLNEEITPVCNRLSFRAAFKNVGTSNEFFGVINRLHRHAVEDGWRPILHLEIHGSPPSCPEVLPSCDIPRLADEVVDSFVPDWHPRQHLLKQAGSGRIIDTGGSFRKGRDRRGVHVVQVNLHAA